jgi:hypothetical protein
VLMIVQMTVGSYENGCNFRKKKFDKFIGNLSSYTHFYM